MYVILNEMNKSKRKKVLLKYYKTDVSYKEKFNEPKLDLFNLSVHFHFTLWMKI